MREKSGRMKARKDATEERVKADAWKQVMELRKDGDTEQWRKNPPRQIEIKWVVGSGTVGGWNKREANGGCGGAGLYYG